jgi:hypothetical protein
MTHRWFLGDRSDAEKLFVSKRSLILSLVVIIPITFLNALLIYAPIAFSDCLGRRLRQHMIGDPHLTKDHP